MQKVAGDFAGVRPQTDNKTGAAVTISADPAGGKENTMMSIGQGARNDDRCR
jgi:hypothetical protein